MSSSNSASSDLAAALSDGGCLLDSKHTTGNAVPASDLKSVLETRLSQYFQRLGKDERPGETADLEDVQLRTADEALSVVERVQRIIGVEEIPTAEVGEGNHPSNIPAIGTRDLAQLRMLISIVFKWGIDPLLARVVQAWPSKPSAVGSSRIIDLTTTPDDHRLLSSLLFRVFSLLFPTGVHAQLPQTLITTTLLNRHITDILRPCITLGWLPKSLSSNSMPTVHDLRPLSMRLLSILPPSQTITTLGTVLSSTPKLPTYVQKTCASLLSRQLLRPNGVRGLFEAVFGEEETGDIDVPVEKLEHVSRVLSTVPSNTKPQEYFHIIISRIISILLEDAPAAYKRAAAFSISQLLADEVSSRKEPASTITLSTIHKPFLELPSDDSNQTDSNSASPNPNLQPSNALSALISLISNADPSPVFISNLLSPIVPILYSLLYHFEKHKASDPTLKVSLHGILVTWGKIVTQVKGIEVLSYILDSGEGSEWRVDLEGNFTRAQKAGPPSGLDLLTPDNVNDGEEPDIDTNLFNLYPDPSHFVQFLKSIERGDISSEIFVKLLEAYHTQKSDANSDPMQILRYLQVIMQMQKQMTEGTTSNILRTPAHILTFIKHVLESAQSQDSSGVKSARSTAPTIKDELLENGDSDDDMEDSEIVGPDDEMVETAINLLLSILEVNEDLSARTMPILNDIFSLLEPIVWGRSSSLSSVAREARMVMTARLAATSKGTRKANATEEDNAQEIYQKALKLLQDPILPVRAHGLLLLRQLVTPSRDSKNTQAVDSAFVPAILSIFLQFLQDDDSYMFLNAVQGLAAMVDRFGKEVLRRLVNEYASGLQGIAVSNLTQQDIDIRTRIGEALGTVIKRCGAALGIYADMLIPPLFNILRSREIPTTLRTSSLSLLADCIKTYPVAIVPYLEDLASSMIDLIQIESVQTLTGSARADSTKREDGDLDEPSPTMDSHPTSLNSKFPPLRRAALHFLTLLIRETTRDIYDSPSTLSGEGVLSNSLIKRAKITLGYIAFTDTDNVVRIMAREAGDDLAQLQDAITGV